MLGVLSREEIEEYTMRSQELRAARAWRNQPPPPMRRPPPTQAGERLSAHSTTDEDDSSDSEHYTIRRSTKRGSSPRSVAGSDLGWSSGYPNAFGVRPPSPPSPQLSPRDPSVSTAGKAMGTSRYTHDRDTQGRIRPSDLYDVDRRKSSSPAREDKEYSQHHRQNSSSRQSSHSNSRSDRDREAGKKGRKWRHGAKAAGLGGAAMGLLSVLTEAAEGL